MTTAIPKEGSLVLYRLQPARITRAGEKLTLELPGGETARVRPKDVTLLHAGPLASLADLRPVQGEVEAAWEILAGGRTTLPELAELAFGQFSPATAWAAWQLVADGLYFRGTPGDIEARSAEEVAHTQASRSAEAAEKQARAEFLARARQGRFDPADARYWGEVEALALGQSANARAMRALGRDETPADAHHLLLEAGVWDDTVNPHPIRLGVILTAPAMAAEFDWPPEERLDLTGLPAFAIDDALTETPDDAVSFGALAGVLGGEECLWVHVADPAAVVTPDSSLDLEARARGATLHLPEVRVPMLPPELTPIFGLGLGDRSPALSFALRLGADATPDLLDVFPSWVRVTRLTYEEGDTHLDEPPLDHVYALALAYEARRARLGRIAIELPEASVRVLEGEIAIEPVRETRSRTLVENAMIMTGEAVARFALANRIPLPFATQEPPEGVAAEPDTTSMAAMVALRRSMKRSQYRTSPGRHAGLGLDAYVQATSPMRRYLDLLVHQQLRAARNPVSPRNRVSILTEAEILERIGAVEAVIGDLRAAEGLSNRHWTLAALQRRAAYRADGVVVDRRGQATTLILPELALETQLYGGDELPLDSTVSLALRYVDLPRLEARFRPA